MGTTGFNSRLENMKATARCARWRSSISGHAQESMRSNTSPQHAHAMKCAGSAPTLPLAFAKFAEATLDRPPVEANGSKTTLLTRVEVVVEADMEPAYWLAHQSVYPRVYFSNQNKSLRAAGVGAAQRIGGTGVDSDEALAAAFGSLAGAHPRTRFYGGMRFDSQAKQLQEWDSFGGSVFILPLWELQVRQCNHTHKQPKLSLVSARGARAGLRRREDIPGLSHSLVARWLSFGWRGVYGTELGPRGPKCSARDAATALVSRSRVVRAADSAFPRVPCWLARCERLGEGGAHSAPGYR